MEQLPYSTLVPGEVAHSIKLSHTPLVSVITSTYGTNVQSAHTATCQVLRASLSSLAAFRSIEIAHFEMCLRG